MDDQKHLAEVNIAEALYDLDDPRMAGFVDNLDRINGLAERMPGYVWRLKNNEVDPVSVLWDSNPRIVVNISVWETAVDLKRFVFNTVHQQILDRRADWFHTMKSHHFALWWVPVGHTPDMAEAQVKLKHLDTHGSSPEVFGWDEIA